MTAPSSPDRFDRKLYNRARVALPLVTGAGSAAWSPAGRASLVRPEYRLGRSNLVEPGDRSLPIVYRN